MSKHPQPTAFKEDYRNILSQRSPEQQFAVFKLVAFFIILAVIVLYLFAGS